MRKWVCKRYIYYVLIFIIKNSNLSFLEQLFLKKAKKGLDRKLAPI